MNQLYKLAYSTVSSNLFFFNKYSLNIVVQSIFKNKNGEDDIFYKTYPGTNGLDRAYINFKYWMEIRSFQRDTEGVPNAFRIDDNNYWQFMTVLNNISNWLTGSKPIFVKDKKGIIRVQDAKPIKLEGAFGAILEFDALVRTNSNDQQTPGIGIYVNADQEPIFMDQAKFMNFKYFMDRLNPYEVAMQLVAFMGKPEPMDDTPQENPNKPKSFFEKLGAKPKENK